MYFNGFFIKSVEGNACTFVHVKDPLTFFSIDISSLRVEEDLIEDFSLSFLLLSISENLIDDKTNIVNRTIECFLKSLVAFELKKNKSNKIEYIYPIEGKAYIDRPVFCYIPDFGRTYCFMYFEDTDCFKISYSTKNPKDNHFKRIGNNIAWNKMQNGDYITLNKEQFLNNIVNVKKIHNFLLPKYLVELFIDFDFFKSVDKAISKKSFSFFDELDNFIFFDTL